MKIQISKRSASLVGAMLLVAIVDIPDVARAARYCAQLGDGTRNCGYYSMRQCRASSRNCFRVPSYHYTARRVPWSVGYGNYSTHRGVSHTY